MLTCTKLSTISYNTDKFLQTQLNELLFAHKIRFWCYIMHMPEEAELKEHKHLLIYPDERIDTRELDDWFIEKDPNNEKPLRCIDWNHTKNPLDWFLYGLHDPIYCAEKFKEVKKFVYGKGDFNYSDDDIFERYFFMAFHEFDFWATSKYKKMLDNGITPTDMVKNGYVSFKEMVNFHYFCKSLAMDSYSNNTAIE